MSNNNKENKTPAPEQQVVEEKVVAEEKKVEAPKVDSTEEKIKKEIAELEKQYIISRSVVEQADISARIGKLKKDLKEDKSARPVVDVYQKDVPVRLDHTVEKDKTRVPYQPVGDGKTFITTL